MNVTFGEWLRAQRKAAGMTQEALAASTGLVKGQVSRLELGMVKATADIARPLIAAVNAEPVEAAAWLERLETMRTPAPKPTLYPSAARYAAPEKTPAPSL